MLIYQTIAELFVSEETQILWKITRYYPVSQYVCIRTGQTTASDSLCGTVLSSGDAMTNIDPNIKNGIRAKVWTYETYAWARVQVDETNSIISTKLS